MPNSYNPRLVHKQEPFLKAFERTGKIGDAAKAVRISRDAVHDWRRRDNSFSRAFVIAKIRSVDRDLKSLHEHFDYFTTIIRPFIPKYLWPRLITTLTMVVSARAAATKQFKEDASPMNVPSQVRAGIPTLPFREMDKAAISGNVGIQPI